MNANRMEQLEAARRAEHLAEQIARGACEAAVSGRPNDLEIARMALESHRRAKELRERLEAEAS